MIDVFDIISTIEAGKKSKSIVPSYATFPEVTAVVNNLIKTEINNLVAEGKIRWSETLNSYGFSTINK